MSDEGGMNMKGYIRGISPNIGVKLWDPEGEGTKLDIKLEDFLFLLREEALEGRGQPILHSHRYLNTV